MSETTHADNQSVYEIGYLIVSSIPEEKVPAEAEAITKIVKASGASMIADEAPHRMKLAYEMRKKNVGGTYEKYNDAFFGWTKFEVGSDKIEAVKKQIEAMPSILRMLLIATVKENTYLGKRAPAIAAEISLKKGDKTEEAAPVAKKEAAAPASIEEMDKSIDDMVKEV
jgi:ribosomal protein S6